MEKYIHKNVRFIIYKINIDRKVQKDSNPVIVGDFNTQFLSLNRSSKLKVNISNKKLTDKITHIATEHNRYVPNIPFNRYRIKFLHMIQ